MNNFLKLVISILIPELLGIVSGVFTVSSIPTWYQTLNKPSFSPPNWLFGPVWTTLYLLMGIAAWLVWKRGLKNKKVRLAMGYFFIQLILNFFWSLIFFGFRSPLLALIEIVILWYFIFQSIIKFYSLSKSAGYLLIPYIFWVSFAAILNLSIVVLNK